MNALWGDSAFPFISRNVSTPKLLAGFKQNLAWEFHFIPGA